MPPLPDHVHQQFLASLTRYPPIHQMDATFNNGPQPVLEISDDDDDDSDVEFSTFAPAASESHQFNTRSNHYSEPIDLTSDSDGELTFLGRSRPSHVPQPPKRIRLEPTGVIQAGASASARPRATPGLPSHEHSLPTINNGASPANNYDDFSFLHETGARTPVMPTNPNGINTDLPLLPNLQKQPTRKKPKVQKPAPYVWDRELEVTMYRGPGYERFNVALGTNNEHQIICNKWDAAQERRRQRKAMRLFHPSTSTRAQIHDPDSESESESGSDEATDNDEQGTTPFDHLCLSAVLEVIPDAQRQFVLDKIMKSPWRKGKVRNTTTLTHSDLVIPQTIISELLELGSYPKQPKATKSEALPDDGTGKTIAWNKDIPKDPMYFKEAVILLAKVFDHTPTYYIHKMVHDKKSLFDTFVHLDEQDTKFHQISPRPYARLRLPRVVIEKKYQLTPREQRNPHQYAQQINELQAAKQYCAREAHKGNVAKEKEKAEQVNAREHKAIGAITTCGCCFEETVPLNRIVICDADPAHSFCFTCVSGLAESQVGLMKYEMKCMDATNCKASLSWSAIAKAIDIKTFDRLEFNKQQAEIMAAGLEGLEQCPFCDFKAICDTVDVNPVFACQNPECQVVSCRKCHLESHLPKTCEEHKKENDLTARHRVEEARSDAVMRTCPKCKVKIIKEDGCNKMVCSTCRTFMCYECQEDLSKLGPNVYNHFNKPGAKCSLYDRVGVDRHEVEADDAEREAIRKAKEEDSSIDETRLRVETGKPKPTALDLHPARDMFMRHANRQDHNLRMLRDLQQQRQGLLLAEQVRREARRQREAIQHRIPDRLVVPAFDMPDVFFARQDPRDFGHEHHHARRRMAEPANNNTQPHESPDNDKGKGKEPVQPLGQTNRYRGNTSILLTEPPVPNINYPLVPPLLTQPNPVPQLWRGTELRTPHPAFGPMAWGFSPNGSFGSSNEPPHTRLPPPPYAPPDFALDEAQETFGLPPNYDAEDDYGFRDLFGERPRPA